MQSYNKLFIKQLFFNTENGDEVRRADDKKDKKDNFIVETQ